MRNAYVRALFIAIFGLLAIWVPSDNGRVVQIVAIEGGRAYLDIDGDGQADDSDSLLSTTVAERTRLANTYGAGATLWRVPIPHFTPWDRNWPYGPPEDAIGPDVDASPSVDDPTGCSDEAHGSIIECEAQGLRETIPVGGAPFTLSYSTRVPGRTDLRTIRIPVTGPQVLPSLRRVEVKVTRTFQTETKLGSWDARAAGLGAWTLNVHHFYGYKGRMLYMGDGTRRQATEEIGPIQVVARRQRNSGMRISAILSPFGREKATGGGSCSSEAEMRIPILDERTLLLATFNHS